MTTLYSRLTDNFPGLIDKSQPVDTQRLIHALYQWLPEFAPASQEVIDAARDLHCVDRDYEVDIDSDAAAFAGDGGRWVQAWLWVPDDVDEDEDEDEDEDDYFSDQEFRR